MDVDVGHLLYELCTQLGYCVPQDENRRLIADPPPTVDAFTDEVLRVEGLDPDLMPPGERLAVRDLVARHFDNAP
jgi:hypothetical protein